MKLFKSYLNHVNLLLIGLATILGCATRYYPVEDLGRYISVSEFSSPNEAIIRNYQAPQDVFNYYCKRGKQIRPLTRTIKGVIPRAEKGQLVAVAAQKNQEAVEKLRKAVNTFYSIGLPWNPNFRNMIELEGTNKYGKSNGYALQMAALPFNTFDRYLSYFKSGYSEKITPVVIEFDDPKKPIILGLKSIPTYIAIPTRVGLTQKTKHQIRPKNLEGEREENWGGFMGAPSPVALNVDTSKTEKTVYPIRLGRPFEPIIFANYYTMLIPLEVQVKIFKDRIERLHASGLYFINEDLTFNLSDAVTGRGKLWETYIESMTTVKETETEDPQIINYQVSLDLNPLCAYGRPVTDFLTK